VLAAAPGVEAPPVVGEVAVAGAFVHPASARAATAVRAAAYRSDRLVVAR